jgi:RNA polymerase sigma factor (sigma-70 family)
MLPLAQLWTECVADPDSQEAWERLYSEQQTLVVRVVRRVARRFGIAADDVSDAVQEVWMKLSVQARTPGPLRLANDELEAYLRACIANAAHDFYRARHARRRDVRVTTAFDEQVHLRISGLRPKDLDRDLLLKQIELMAGENPRDKHVFLLYYRRGWSAKEISGIPSLGLSEKGVESLIFRIVKEVRQQLGGTVVRAKSAKGFSRPDA